MTIQMTLNLPDGLVRCAQQWARHTHREVEDIIAQAAALGLPPLEEADSLDEKFNANLSSLSSPET